MLVDPPTTHTITHPKTSATGSYTLPAPPPPAHLVLPSGRQPARDGGRKPGIITRPVHPHLPPHQGARLHPQQQVQPEEQEGAGEGMGVFVCLYVSVNCAGQRGVGSCVVGVIRRGRQQVACGTLSARTRLSHGRLHASTVLHPVMHRCASNHSSIGAALSKHAVRLMLSQPPPFPWAIALTPDTGAWHPCWP